VGLVVPWEPVSVEELGELSLRVLGETGWTAAAKVLVATRLHV